MKKYEKYKKDEKKILIKVSPRFEKTEVFRKG